MSSKFASSTQRENLLKTEIRRYLDSEHIWWGSCAAGPFSREGDPDIIACVNGRLLAIEGKAPGGRQRGAQISCQKEIEACGGVYILAYSLDDVIAAVKPLKYL